MLRTSFGLGSMETAHPAPNRPATVTQICRLRFRDGKVVTAQLEAGSLRDDAIVSYSGPCHRLPFQYPTADMIVLRALFQSFARELKAEFEEDVIGDWHVSEEAEEEAMADAS